MIQMQLFGGRMECIAAKKKTSILRLSSSLTRQKAMHCCQEENIHPEIVFFPNLPECNALLPRRNHPSVHF
jgi:NAD-dependent SIR2 family protein deacetylase